MSYSFRDDGDPFVDCYMRRATDKDIAQKLRPRSSSLGHRVVGQSRGDYYEVAAAIGCEYVQSADKLMDCEPHIVVFCTSIMSLDTVLSRFPLKRYVSISSISSYPTEQRRRQSRIIRLYFDAFIHAVVTCLLTHRSEDLPTSLSQMCCLSSSTLMTYF